MGTGDFEQEVTEECATRTTLLDVSYRMTNSDGGKFFLAMHWREEGDKTATRGAGEVAWNRDRSMIIRPLPM
jgi:hypothetical protein